MSEQIQYFFNEHDDALIVESGGNLKTAKKIYRLLWDKPRTINEIANDLELSYHYARKHVRILQKVESVLVVKIPHTNYYRLANRNYIYDYLNDKISDIPRCYFRNIPVIQRWFNLNLTKPKQLRYITTLEKLCYGDTAKTFAINPSKWVHPDSLEAFVTAFKQEHQHELPEFIVNALRAFYLVCLKVRLDKSESEYYGLVIDTRSKGKHKHLRLSEQELQAAIQWLQSPEAEELARQNGLSIEGLRAHAAFSLEAFPRPSRCLTIETNSIEFHQKQDGSPFLKFRMWESKQDQFYVKYVTLNHTLVQWAAAWVKHRLAAKRKYLFVDDNDYQSRPYDTAELQEEREPFIICYRALFKTLGKTEPIWYDDTLYCLRHAGVMRWMQVLKDKPNGIYRLTKMGWKKYETLLTFYADITDEDVIGDL